MAYGRLSVVLISHQFRGVLNYTGMGAGAETYGGVRTTLSKRPHDFLGGPRGAVRIAPTFFSSLTN